MTLESLKYPIGHFVKPPLITDEIVRGWILDIEVFPKRLKEAVVHLSDEQLDTVYRLGGWTIRQVVHHCADSHMNSFIRFKLALTEETPTIKPYYEERWAELIDAKEFPISSSLQILEGVHSRWCALLRSISAKEFARTFVHPQQEKIFRIDENIGLYAWHCNHHLAHILELKKRNKWG